MTPLNYIPEETINRELPDGRIIQVAVKGVPMSITDAIRYELLSDAEFSKLNIPKPANYGSAYLNPPAEAATETAGTEKTGAGVSTATASATTRTRTRTRTTGRAGARK